MARNAAQVFESIAKERLLGPVDLENAKTRWDKPNRPNLESAQHCVKWLVTNHFITPFQAEHLLLGKSDALRIDEYVVREKVVDGPFAEGFIGADSLNRQVVLQLGNTAPTASGSKTPNLDELKKTISLLDKVENNHLQKAVGCGVHQGRAFIAWQWWEGCSLGTAMAKKGKVQPQKACRIFATVLAGAQSLHEAGLRVGKVDLDSVFLAIEPGKGEGRVVKLLGPGIQPDWVNGDVRLGLSSHQDEVYSIGKAMYRAITGSAVSEDGKMRAPVASLTPDIPEHLAEFLDQLTDPDPAIRFTDAKVAGKALRILIATEEGESTGGKDQDPLAEVKPAVNSNPATKDDSEIGEDGQDWLSGKISTLLEKAGITPRELVFLSAGALATVMFLLLGLWLVGDLMPLIALGLGAMGGYYLNAWLAKRPQAE